MTLSLTGPRALLITGVAIGHSCGLNETESRENVGICAYLDIHYMPGTDLMETNLEPVGLAVYDGSITTFLGFLEREGRALEMRG